MAKHMLWAMASATILLASCSSDIPTGRFACITGDDCPADWVCECDRCYPTSPGSCIDASVDADVDGGTTEGGPDDGGPDDAGPLDGGPCDDLVACTTDTVVDGGCASVPDHTECAGVDCAVATCEIERGCTYTLDVGMCPERPCNTVRCDEMDGCTYEPLPNGTECADMDFCNGAETCMDGTCDSPGDPCPGASSCNEAMDVCTGCAGDSDCPPDRTTFTACVFASECATTGMRDQTTTSYRCPAGTCVEDMDTTSVSMGCNRVTDGLACPADSEECTDDICAGGSCTHPNEPDDTACTSDGESCTRDVCVGGTCEHLARPHGTSCPADGDPCTKDECRSGTCMHPTEPDGTGCGTWDVRDVCCDGDCKNLLDDDRNCGACGITCPAGTGCERVEAGSTDGGACVGCSGPSNCPASSGTEWMCVSRAEGMVCECVDNSTCPGGAATYCSTGGTFNVCRPRT